MRARAPRVPPRLKKLDATEPAGDSARLRVRRGKLAAMHDHTHLIVSCILGPRFRRVYPAVPGYRNVFFSNNPAIRPHVEAQGWNFALLDQFQLSDDILMSSLQAKWVKFLPFLDSMPGYDDVATITYHDHEFEVRDEHIAWLLRASTRDDDLLVRVTPRAKTSIAAEIAAAMKQERYVCHMPETLAYLDSLQASGQISPEVRIVNTGLIHYRNLPACRPFCRTIHDTCLRLGQPECQIIWAAESQMSDIRIRQVAWKSLRPLWKTP